MKIIRISFGVRGFTTVYNDAVKWNYMLTEKAKHKIKVLVFMEKHGPAATLDAFPHKRSTVFEQKKILKKNNGRLESLNEKFTRPENNRKVNWNADVVKFIEDQRNLLKAALRQILPDKQP